ncbi:methanogenesis marker 16 metalloprotein [Methanotorris igneus]|uniref:Methanogenesis marker 16 metalloprotein n=1 Tax=Methanotorris igneus (strain DSM 5666 / JCM 11834 / Kol 5) TaxID=880724 RepID=F6BBK0_METIK|nr:methanogenesis marker 16 metalloprotein [Methanotorris igneus]AEF96009.1 methanogenesis marker 16 metalloprotein [Methanotorris igneus Kol 5]
MDKVVVTIDELKKMIRNNEEDKIDEIDIVTAATCGIMSGTMAIFYIPMNDRFRKAEKVYLNGIRGFPGPCPNEYLGSVDVVVFGTEHNGDYGGGFLFKDLVKGKEVEVKVECDGKIYEREITLDEIPTARMIGTRMAFKNYVAVTNFGDEPIKTIFHRKFLRKGEASFSGCGEINPLQNMHVDEKELVGKKILLNGAEGVILGFGTRYSKEKPNIMISADMHNMDAYYLGGFITSTGPEVFNTIAIPIEVNEKHKEYLKKLDEDIDLPLTNVIGRKIVDVGKYSEVWKDVDLRPHINVYRCRNCDFCIVEELCPTKAVRRVEYLGGRRLPNEDCFGCGVCATSCPYGIYQMKLGSILGIPITCRQSDRERALKLAEELKERIIKGEFKI